MTSSSFLAQLTAELRQGRAVTLVTVVGGPKELVGQKALIPAQGSPAGSLLQQPWHTAMLHDAARLMQSRLSPTTQTYRHNDIEIEIFFDVQHPPPRLIIVGAVHIADALIRYAKALDFRTWLVDPRSAFATASRFPHADEICPQWPEDALPAIGITPYTAVVVITHDPKLDDPALKIALPSPAFYVGALGSNKTNAQRRERLQAEGISESLLNRLHAPIGLNIGGRTPAEIALSIMAEIVAVQNRTSLNDSEA